VQFPLYLGFRLCEIRVNGIAAIENMNLCIHRGAKEIGGSCVELEAEGQRLLLDLGLPLDAELEETPLPDVSGLEKLDESLLGIAS
jgi:ribonuclease J